jgi:hypothetical protein
MLHCKSQWACDEACDGSCGRVGEDLAIKLAMRLCLYIAMGSQWACNGPAMGPHSAPRGLQWATAMGLQWEQQFPQWARNAPAMGLQWACNGILMCLQWGLVTFIYIIGCGSWTPLQAHCRPIASPLQESLCANKLTSRYLIADLIAKQLEAPLRAHCAPIAGPIASPWRAHCTPITGPLQSPNRSQAPSQARCQARAGHLTSACYTNYALPKPSALKYQTTYLCLTDLLHHVGPYL